MAEGAFSYTRTSFEAPAEGKKHFKRGENPTALQVMILELGLPKAPSVFPLWIL